MYVYPPKNMHMWKSYNRLKNRLKVLKFKIHNSLYFFYHFIVFLRDSRVQPFTSCLRTGSVSVVTLI